MSLKSKVGALQLMASGDNEVPGGDVVGSVGIWVVFGSSTSIVTKMKNYIVFQQKIHVILLCVSGKIYICSIEQK